MYKARNSDSLWDIQEELLSLKMGIPGFGKHSGLKTLRVISNKQVAAEIPKVGKIILKEGIGCPEWELRMDTGEPLPQGMPRKRGHHRTRPVRRYSNLKALGEKISRSTEGTKHPLPQRALVIHKLVTTVSIKSRGQKPSGSGEWNK